jgi:type VI protein secretion system component VasK
LVPLKAKDSWLVNLMLAIIWFVVGGYLLVDAWSHPEGTLGAMPGFVALGLAAYNVVRWWAARRLDAARQQDPPRRSHRPPEANDHLFRLEDEPIPLPPNTHIQAGPANAPTDAQSGSDKIKE